MKKTVVTVDWFPLLNGAKLLLAFSKAKGHSVKYGGAHRNGFWFQTHKSKEQISQEICSFLSTQCYA